MVKYRERIEKMRLRANIQLLGYKSGQEKFNIIKSSKCFWFFSYTESFPVAPLEAVCCGIKTLVYDLEAYTMYHTGEVIRVKLADYQAAAGKVLEIFDAGKFENKPGKKLFHKISWSWDKIAAIEYKALFPN